MSKEKNGGAAFPGFDYYRTKPLPAESQGMGLRDYFAAKCMASVIGSLKGPVTGEEHPGDFDYYASCAYKIADAMLRAREAS